MRLQSRKTRKPAYRIEVLHNEVGDVSNGGVVIKLFTIGFIISRWVYGGQRMKFGSIRDDHEDVCPIVRNPDAMIGDEIYLRRDPLSPSVNTSDHFMPAFTYRLPNTKQENDHLGRRRHISI